jgi:hypothetical protein
MPDLFPRLSLASLLLASLFLLESQLPTASASRRSEYRAYRTLRRNIAKRYYKARKPRYKAPCRAKDQLLTYQSWLTQLVSALPSKVANRRYRRFLRSRALTFQRYTRSQLRYTKKRCRRYWKKELARIGSKLNKQCQAYRSMHPSEGAWLWVGARPWANVYINGQLCGIAPMRASLRPGSYKIRLSFPPGQDEYKTNIEVMAGQTPILIARFMNRAPKASRRYKTMLSPKQLAWTIKQHKSQFSSCRIFQAATKQVTLSWKIQSNGTPHSFQWVSPVGPSKRFRRCILRAAKRMRFPKSKSIASIQSYNISLD